ncbi:hypothetical protein QR680_011130 [Steinernema hermaphroditum]|uniref:Uncharacterized protein n=1 Tax=Steinernema hermaphroditum TaxID=289476 RepID=A0AA39IR76_9BILA|nr:hypothetical protein QR680_011130 [Steinernema hermaphroditum]
MKPGGTLWSTLKNGTENSGPNIPRPKKVPEIVSSPPDSPRTSLQQYPHSKMASEAFFEWNQLSTRSYARARMRASDFYDFSNYKPAYTAEKHQHYLEKYERRMARIDMRLYAPPPRHEKGR